MLESLISQNLDSIIFLLFSLGIVFFSFLSIISQNTVNSIIYFMLAIGYIFGFGSVTTNMPVNIIVILLYVSMCIIFLICRRITGETKTTFNKKSLCILIGGFIAASVGVCYNLKTETYIEKNTENYIGIAGITLAISLLFIVVIVGIDFLFSKSISDESSNN